MLVEIHSVEFGFCRQPQHAHGVDGQHHHHGRREGCQGDGRAPDGLCRQQRGAAAVEQSLQCNRIIGAGRAGSAELAGRKQTQRERSPDSADAVNRNRADRVVNAQPFQQVDAEDDDNSGDAAEQHRARGRDPVARAGDGHQSREEAVGGVTRVPLL